MKVVLGGQISLGNFVLGGHYFQGDNKNCDTGIVFFLLDRSYAIYSNAQSIEGERGPYILVRWSGPVRRIYTPEAATDSPPGPTERKGKKTFNLAQKAYLNSLFEAGLRSASKSQRPFLEKAAADTGLTISQVVSPA